MFHRLLHLLMCLNVLVCPATGGRCCDGANDTRTTTPVVSNCGDSCCHDDGESSQGDTPILPACPNECRDCFCAGALPPDFETRIQELEFDALVAFVVMPMDAPGAFATDRVVRNGDSFLDGFKPLSGRELLNTYCALLL